MCDFGGVFGGLPMLGWAQVLSGGAAEATTTLAPIVVVGTTPLLGIGTPLSLVPANVQTIHGREIDRQHKNTLTEYFEKDVSSVDINEDEAQGNPYQTDIGYRGFAASPPSSVRRKVCRAATSTTT